MIRDQTGAKPGEKPARAEPDGRARDAAIRASQPGEYVTQSLKHQRSAANSSALILPHHSPASWRGSEI